MTPIVDGLEAEYGERVAFVRLNAAGDGAAAFDSLSLPGHPSFVVFDANGSETERAFGVVEVETLHGFIEVLD